MGTTTEYQKLRIKQRRDRKKLIDTEWTPEMQRLCEEIFPCCVVCGGTQRLAVDHIQCLTSGVSLSPSNAVRLCVKCNAKKWQHPLESMPIEFQEKVREASKQFSDAWDAMQKVMYS